MPQDIWDIRTLGSDGTNLPNGQGTMDINILEGDSVLQLKYQLNVSELQQILVALDTTGLKATSSRRIPLGTSLSMTKLPECNESSFRPSSPTTRSSWDLTPVMLVASEDSLPMQWSEHGWMATGP